MNGRIDASTWKMIGGGIIVAAAFLIMMPGIVSYIFSLSRIFTLIVVTVGVAGGGAFIYSRIRGAKELGGQAKVDEPKAGSETTIEG